ncbi:MAG TPA: P-II family nitrogen regulator [Pseudonocardiaceae bacterium]|jgi:nitrogen regulatory protein P-II 1|nr:P-II family nitrogen regulator [Pseudonocardiaceae bacterium]
MKLITAVLRPATFDTVKNALAVFGVRGLTVGYVYGAPSRTPQRIQVYRGQRIEMDLDPLVRIDLLTPDDEAADLVHVIITAAGDGADLAGRIWLTPVDLLVRIRTGEYGTDAL